ncbi:galanin peptides isoform X2 [Festucalex cinctus]
MKCPFHLDVKVFTHTATSGRRDCVAGIYKMKGSIGILLVSLVFCTMFYETIGLVIAAKEKRGWTLNSAGYLLGPHGIDGHKILGDKAGLAGKRDMDWEENFQAGGQKKAEEDIVHTVIDFLTYLKFKEMGALQSLTSSVTSDEMANP